MKTGLEQLIATHICRVRFEDLDPQAVAATLSLLLDTLGVAIAGANLPDLRALRAYALAHGGHAESTLLGDGARVTAEQAALINGALAHALDYDATHGAANVHAYATVFPAALAVAELQPGLSGRELLSSIVVGVDLACRLGLAFQEGLDEGWWPTSLFGAFGATAAAARLLGLAPPQVQQALGIAYAQAAGNRQAMLDGGTAKSVQCGLAARTAITSAQLARSGITGASHFLSGPFGFATLYARGAFQEAALGNELGRHFLGAEATWKPYPCCSAAQAPIQAALELVRERPLEARRTAAIHIRATRPVAEQLGCPFQPGSNRIQSQVSLPYLVSTAVLRGRMTLQELEDGALTDQHTLQLARHVTVEALESAGLRHAELPVTVELLAQDGTRRARTVDQLSAPGQPSSREALREKFRACLLHAGGEPLLAWGESLSDCLLGLETLETVDVFTRVLRSIPTVPARA